MTELKIGEIKYLEDDLRIIASRLRVLRVHALSGSRCRPVMRRGRTILKGVPLNDDNFRPISYIGDVPNKLFVIDVSMRILMDFGSIKVYAVKSVVEEFKNNESRIDDVCYRLIPVKSKEYALKELAIIEYNKILEVIVNKEPEVLLIDRPLFRANILRNGKLLDMLLRSAMMKCCTLIGISKSSSIELEDGTPLAGYLCMRAEVLGLNRWYYYPLFPEDKLSIPVKITFVKIGINKNLPAFRVDIYSPKEDDLDRIIAMLPSLEDSSHPGYPYPLIRAHRDSKIRKSELRFLRMLVEEKVNFSDDIFDLVMFRREELEGRRSDLD
ncbi:MAG: hypothetical protein DRJ66_05915 [Thermoprotei archaeon]|nr:MAG: hypothetical protein DRJ66_05915 [Thermoprotei archaeon]